MRATVENCLKMLAPPWPSENPLKTEQMCLVFTTRDAAVATLAPYQLPQ
jgi:hypothetical protein